VGILIFVDSAQQYRDNRHTPTGEFCGLMKLYKTKSVALLEHDDRWSSVEGDWDDLITRDDLESFLQNSISKSVAAPSSDSLLAPIGSQEVWAAGVTYIRSRDARIQESESAGGGDFYDRVYDAERPELFFKATPHRVVGPGSKVAIRNDAKWSVPEPELALLISPNGKLLGYTIGNDMSSRDIEGENPLYLPQAKVYDRSCALGPCILVSSDPVPRSTEISIDIQRQTQTVFKGSTTLNSLKRDPATLIEYLYRDNSFPRGCFLLTGTGVVPPDSFTLAHGDEIRITIDGIGTLINMVG
jgi:2-dehydro-3-deoxy-D-arabinonate dehydratase